MPSPAARGEHLLSEHEIRNELSIVVPFRREGTRPPLFFIAGLGGHVLIGKTLAKLMGDDQPVYGLQGIGLDGSEMPLGRMEALAARYIQEIVAVQPHGPYHLAGWSMGATIAYEIALQLLDRGECVGGLAIIDEFAPLPIAFRTRLKWHLSRARRRSWQGWKNLFSRAIARRKRSMLCRFGYHPPVEGLKGLTAAMAAKNAAAQYEAARLYRPRTFAQDVAIIRADGTTRFSDPRAKDPCMGWKPLIRGSIHTFTVPGSHGSIFAPDKVHVLRDVLRDYMGAAREA